MKPIEFPGFNVTFAKDQPEYNPLPAHRSLDGIITSCWELTPEERLEVFNTGKIFISQMAFHKPLQPINMGVTFTPPEEKTFEQWYNEFKELALSEFNYTVDLLLQQEPDVLQAYFYSNGHSPRITLEALQKVRKDREDHGQ